MMATDREMCKGCGEAKNLERFSVDRRSKNGRQGRCKACNAAYGATHKGEKAAYDSVYCTTHRESRVAYLASRREETAAQNAAHHAKNPNNRKARAAVAIAIKSGELVRSNCADWTLAPDVINGRNAIQAHHHKGYEPEKWLDVQWLCQPCHGKVDADLLSP